MGRSVRLHPAVIVLAVLLGGSLAGLVGLLLAVPVAATLRVLLRHLWQHESDYGDDLDSLPDSGPSESRRPAGDPRHEDLTHQDADRQGGDGVREFRRPGDRAPGRPGAGGDAVTDEQEDP